MAKGSGKTQVGNIGIAVIAALAGGVLYASNQVKLSRSFTTAATIYVEKGFGTSREAMQYWGDAGYIMLEDTSKGGVQFVAGMLDAGGGKASHFYQAKDARNPASYEAGEAYQHKERLSIADIEEVAKRVGAVSAVMDDLRRDMVWDYRQKFSKSYEKRPGEQTAGLIFIDAVAEVLGPDAGIHPDILHMLKEWREDRAGLGSGWSLRSSRKYEELQPGHLAAARAVVRNHLVDNPSMREAVLSVLRIEVPLLRAGNLSDAEDVLRDGAASEADRDFARAALSPYAGVDPFTAEEIVTFGDHLTGPK